MALLVAAISLIIFMTLVWFVYLKIQNACIVDSAWSLGYVLVAIVYFSIHGWTQKSLIFFPFLVLWALRLSIFLFITRIYHREIDKRYETIASSWKKSDAFGFFWNYQLQALLIFIISTPLYFISLQEAWRWLDSALVLVLLVALYFEHASDMTLLRFKQAKKPGVCDDGWWGRSRHPNYFFEWLIWSVVSIIAIDSWLSLIALVSPLGLYLLMTHVTGPITEEQSLKSRGEAFKAYQKRVPMFFPKR